MADFGLAYAPPATAMGNAAIGNADVATAAESVTGTASDATAAPVEPESIVEAALHEPSQMLPPETPPVQVATPSTPDPVPNDAKEAVGSIEILDGWLAPDVCIHGGSFRGCYGHGLAADVVSANGATPAQRWISTESSWNWIDAHGKEFGFGRPYLDRDPPHVAPIDGKEYAAHRGETKAQYAGSDIKKGNWLAARDDRSVAKRPKTARASKARTI